jgi:hypothetical protein
MSKSLEEQSQFLIDIVGVNLADGFVPYFNNQLARKKIPQIKCEINGLSLYICTDDDGFYINLKGECLKPVLEEFGIEKRKIRYYDEFTWTDIDMKDPNSVQKVRDIVKRVKDVMYKIEKKSDYI